MALPMLASEPDAACFGGREPRLDALPNKIALEVSEAGHAVPTEELNGTPRVESFCWRVEQLAGEGDFALITGDSGTEKSVALRIFNERLTAQRDMKVGVFSRPQTGLPDFFREMGDLFGVALRPDNR
jgi:hypothetical protein